MQTPKVLPLVLCAAGALLMWAAVKDKSPAQLIKDNLTSQPLSPGQKLTHPTSGTTGPTQTTKTTPTSH